MITHGNNSKLEDKFADKPFAPRKLPFFYGWVVVIAGGFGIIMSMPGQTIGISAFKNSIRDAMGVTDIDISTAYMVGTIISALLLTYAGKALDVLGARIVAPIAALFLGLATFAFSKCDAIASIMAQYLPAKAADFSAVIVLAILFFVLRLSGQGVLTLVCRNMVTKWFNYRRGFATGIMGFFTQPAFSGAAYIFFLLISFYGWRTSWQILGGIAIVLFAPMALLLFRDNPEACGLIPDGRQLSDGEKSHTTHKIAHQFTLKEARRTLTFWTFACSLMISALFVTALSFDIENIFAEAGMTRNTAFASFLPGCILSMIIRPLLGKLADKIQLKHLLRMQLAGLSGFIIATAFLAPGPMFWLYLIGMGISSACFGILIGVSWPHFFGREHLGEISGHVMSLIVFSSAIGPLFFNKLKLITGDYSNAAIACLFATSIIFILTFIIKHPQRSFIENKEH